MVETLEEFTQHIVAREIARHPSPDIAAEVFDYVQTLPENQVLNALDSIVAALRERRCQPKS